MGLFDRVRQVLARVEKVLPGADRAADEPRSPSTGPQAAQEEPPAPGTAQPAQEEKDASASLGAPGAPAAPAAEPRRHRTHTLLPGQSLADVAEQHGVSVQEVAELNGVDPELVFAGQVLRIPHD